MGGRCSIRTAHESKCREAITHMAKAEPSKGFELLGKHRLLLGESRGVMKSSCLV
jgi:hypothetical protein